MDGRCQSRHLKNAISALSLIERVTNDPAPLQAGGVGRFLLWGECRLGRRSAWCYSLNAQAAARLCPAASLSVAPSRPFGDIGASYKVVAIIYWRDSGRSGGAWPITWSPRSPPHAVAPLPSPSSPVTPAEPPAASHLPPGDIAGSPVAATRRRSAPSKTPTDRPADGVRGNEQNTYTTVGYRN